MTIADQRKFNDWLRYETCARHRSAALAIGLLPRPRGLGPRGHRISEGSVELGMAGTHPTLHRDVVLRGGPRVQVHAADGGGGVPGSEIGRASCRERV